MAIVRPIAPPRLVEGTHDDVPRALQALRLVVARLHPYSSNDELSGVVYEAGKSILSAISSS